MERMRSCEKKKGIKVFVFGLIPFERFFFKNIFDGLLIYEVKSFDWI